MCNNNLIEINNNLDKIRVGFCIELNSLNDNIFYDINRLKNIISDNKILLNNQTLFAINKNLDYLSGLVTSNIQLILNDIDKNEKYCDYCIKYY